MKAGIIDSSDNRKYWENAVGSSFDCIFTADPRRLTSCDLLLISQEYCGGSIGAVIENIRSSEKLANIPAAAVTSDSSAENQEILLSQGFDDVIGLPLCPKLILRRIRALSLIPCEEESAANIDLRALMSLQDSGSGAYCVRSVDFGNIFRFVMRILERTDKSAQMLVISLIKKGTEDAKRNKKVMDILSEAVKNCLRRGDMASTCENGTVLVLLVGADDDGGHLVASRIVNSFYSECDNELYELSYDIKEINGK